MHPCGQTAAMSKPPLRYRRMNWSSCTASLRACGSWLIWLDAEMSWLAPHEIREREEIGTVTADGACDTRRCHTAIVDRQATATSGVLPSRWRSCSPPNPQEWPTVDGRLPRRDCPKRTPVRCPALWREVLEMLDRLPCPKPDRSENAQSWAEVTMFQPIRPSVRWSRVENRRASAKGGS